MWLLARSRTRRTQTLWCAYSRATAAAAAATTSCWGTKTRSCRDFFLVEGMRRWASSPPRHLWVGSSRDSPHFDSMAGSESSSSAAAQLWGVPVSAIHAKVNNKRVLELAPRTRRSERTTGGVNADAVDGSGRPATRAVQWRLHTRGNRILQSGRSAMASGAAIPNPRRNLTKASPDGIRHYIR
jgi:hypothetical protein